MKFSPVSLLLLPVVFALDKESYLRQDRLLNTEWATTDATATDAAPVADPRITWSDEKPMGKCAGDCDSDEDCVGTLKCFHHEPNMAIPGCSGGEENDSKTDYCIPEDLFPVGQAQVNGTAGTSISWSTTFPLSMCQGDCDDDDDCADGLVCFRRTPNEAVPGCLGGEDNDSETDYCISVDVAPPTPTPIPEINWSTTLPLQMCEGDCDTNADCGEGMGCFQRTANEAVPGCAGGEDNDSETDYCTDLNLIPETPAPAPGAAATTDGPKISWSENFPLQLCEGDCDDDRDCDTDLVCFHHDPNTAVPGCSGGEDNDSKTDYCVPKDLAPPSHPKITWSENFPLGICEGDCDNDDDCEGELTCHHHDPNTAVPGCRGGEDNDSKTDYCVPPAVDASTTQNVAAVPASLPAGVDNKPATKSGPEEEGGSDALLISLLTIGFVGAAVAAALVVKKRRRNGHQELGAKDLELGDQAASKGLAKKYSVFKKTSLSAKAVGSSA